MNDGQAKTALERGGRTGSGAVRISVVLPVYEEGGTIGDLIPRLMDTLGRLGEFEVVVVDDSSQDETPAILRQLKHRYPERLHVAQHLQNRGNGAALRTGIRLAQGEVIVTMDADGQHAADDISKLVEHIPPYDLVIGARTEGYQGAWYRNAGNRFYNRFAGWLTGQRILDLTSGFRAMRRAVVAHYLPLFPEGFSAPTTTTMAFLKAGYPVRFVPISVGQRRAGTSKINLWKDGYRFIAIILRMIMLYDPLRIFLPVGAGLIALGTVSWGVGLWAAQRPVMPNSTIFLYSSALMTWLLGLIADQISSWKVHYAGDESVVILGPENEE